MTKSPTTPKADAPKAAPKAAAPKADAKAPAAKAAAPKAAAAAKAPKAAKADAPVKGAKVDKPKDGAKPNALQQPLQPSKELAAIVGEGAMPRGEVVSKVWVYIKAHKLQSPKDGRVIVADDMLRKVFGKDECTMFEMNKLLAQHLK
ncbi:MAG: SWIB/MDM2 domain-containing protein [Janthinobacterium lividum]